MKLIPLHVWVERVVMGSAKTALKFKYDLSSLTHIQFNVQGVSFRNGLYELALTNKNMQVRLGLKMVLEC